MNITTDNTQTILNLQTEIESLRAQLSKPQQIPSEVKAYIERLELRLDMASAVLETGREYPLTVDSIKDTLASKPDCLKD